MYIAGIHLPNDRLTEGIVTSSVLATLAGAVYRTCENMKAANEKGGPIKSMPTSLLGKLVTPVHAVAMFLSPLTYLIAIPLNGGVQPSFISRFSLPKFGVSEDVIDTLRVASCLGLAASTYAGVLCQGVLAQSFHSIGVREKPKITSSGPYGVVRHPIYLTAVAQQLVLSLTFWNYIPLATAAICAAAFAVKIPIEEKLIEDDSAVGPEYAEYKKKVPYRLIPKVW